MASADGSGAPSGGVTELIAVGSFVINTMVKEGDISSDDSLVLRLLMMRANDQIWRAILLYGVRRETRDTRKLRALLKAYAQALQRTLAGEE